MKIPERYIDKEVYRRAKKKTDETYKKPSAYASAYLVKTYKSMGGRIKGQESDGKLKQWFKNENWVNLTPFAEGIASSKNQYKCGERAPKQKGPSVCRPAEKAKQFSKAQIKKAVEIKKQKKTINWSGL